MKENIKKGDKVIVFNDYKPLENYHVDTIESAGRKNIFVNRHRNLKFYTETLCSETMGLRIFPGTEEEFIIHIKNEEKKKEIIRDIEHRLRFLSYEKILKIKEIVDEQ